MSEERQFKKALIGGFDREAVIEYIDELLSDLKKCREENARKDERIAELEKKLDEYETAAAASAPANACVEFDRPEDVLSQVDRILQNYLNRED